MLVISMLIFGGIWLFARNISIKKKRIKRNSCGNKEKKQLGGQFMMEKQGDADKAQFCQTDVSYFFQLLRAEKENYFTFKKKEKMQKRFQLTYRYLCQMVDGGGKVSSASQEFLGIFRNFDDFVTKWNHRYIQLELKKQDTFFENMDGKSLDWQQRLAVVTDNDHNLIVAGAGSGKTLTIAAKVKYLVECKGVSPKDILLLSFTNQAAMEMTKRIHEKLKIMLEATTFHKLGMRIIQSYGGEKKEILSSLTGCILKYFKEEILKDEQAVKRILYFYFYYLDIYDCDKVQSKSMSDSKLYIEGGQSKYAYSKGKVYDGKAYEEKYMEDLKKTRLASFSQNRLFEKAVRRLNLLHLEEQAISSIQLYKILLVDQVDPLFQEFEKLVETFINLWKGSGRSTFKLNQYENLNCMEIQRLTKRNQLFLEIIEPVFNFYSKYLKDKKAIDFNDMIYQAITIIENGNLRNLPSLCCLKYIIVDEFQDISVSRYRLIKALQEKTNAKIICVGDDWQSIYRFSGSDIDVFCHFEKYFGKSEILKIEKTYRNSQELIDVAGRFVQKNPEQIKKNLKSCKILKKPIIAVYYQKDAKRALKNIFYDIFFSNKEPVDILLLGRTNYDINLYLDDSIQYDKKTGNVLYTCYPTMKIRFLTVHSSKGLEADQVILLNMKNAITGFPSKISSDPVLSMVLQNNETYEFAEERRLFYVAITRTRNKTYLLVPKGKESIFFQEIKKESAVKILYSENSLLES